MISASNIALSSVSLSKGLDRFLGGLSSSSSSYSITVSGTIGLKTMPLACTVLYAPWTFAAFSTFGGVALHYIIVSSIQMKSAFGYDILPFAPLVYWQHRHRHPLSLLGVCAAYYANVAVSLLLKWLC